MNVKTKVSEVEEHLLLLIKNSAISPLSAERLMKINTTTLRMVNYPLVATYNTKQWTA